jgi:hypothetical protein
VPNGACCRMTSSCTRSHHGHTTVTPQLPTTTCLSFNQPACPAFYPTWLDAAAERKAAATSTHMSLTNTLTHTHSHSHTHTHTHTHKHTHTCLSQTLSHSHRPVPRPPPTSSSTHVPAATTAPIIRGSSGTHQPPQQQATKIIHTTAQQADHHLSLSLSLTGTPGATRGKEPRVSRAAVVAATVVRPCIAPLRPAHCCCCCCQAGQGPPVVALKFTNPWEPPPIGLHIRGIPEAAAAAAVGQTECQGCSLHTQLQMSPA